MPSVDVSRAQWRLIMPQGLRERLHAHLFPGDGDEHGAVIAAGMAVLPNGRVHLLARSLHLATDGIDYVPGKRGYRMLRAAFVRDRAMECRDERLVYLAIHNHGGKDSVGFSGDDFASHERGYPALLDITGKPVGALVFARNAIAGDIWLPGGGRVALEGANVVGLQRHLLAPAPRPAAASIDPDYDRQARLFGVAGQAILRRSKVAIIGLGGVGSLLAEYLGHLGVGEFVLIDPDRAEPSNLPRLVGARRRDAWPWLAREGNPAWLRRVTRRMSTPKVDIATRLIHRINRQARVAAINGDVLHPANAAMLLDCDYLFLAADTMSARLLFNNIVHQYLIPGAQAGSKVSIDKDTGEVMDVFCVSRPVTPETGCLWCNQLINPAKLQDEGVTEAERAANRYGLGADAPAPSVITLNALAAGQAVNDFLFYITGLARSNGHAGYLRFSPLSRSVVAERPRRSTGCVECGKESHSRLARGDDRPLTTLWVT